MRRVSWGQDSRLDSNCCTLVVKYTRVQSPSDDLKPNIIHSPEEMDEVAEPREGSLCNQSQGRTLKMNSNLLCFSFNTNTLLFNPRGALMMMVYLRNVLHTVIITADGTRGLSQPSNIHQLPQSQGVMPASRLHRRDQRSGEDSVMLMWKLGSLCPHSPY